ncbi:MULTISPECIES: sulfurtransferase [Chelativorans]|jgi:thiosulfate/3-mercaptopyruvate sulfurtransferase|uniref:Rhodanese-like protein n=1 Tax=Chelativorans sp. (strain BNC1) TaxID=266779 RepID=Q11BW0_CHESB|nr:MULTISPECIES: sulfurtransferase [Chelativorans]
MAARKTAIDLMVNTDWLLKHLDDPDLVVVDCTWTLKDAARRGRELYLDRHLPGARFLDIEKVADTASPYATMLPTPEVFASAMGELGISRDTRVVVTADGYTSGRGWFLFRVMGHPWVRILQGGNDAWALKNYPLEAGEPPVVEPRSYIPAPETERVVALHEMKEIIATGSAAVVDARNTPRFTGEAGLSHGDLPGGHMPGAVNIPYGRFLDEHGGFVSPETAARIFAEHGVPESGSVVVTCGSGISALVPGLMLEQLGRDWRLYDGSWNEWVQQPDTPKVISRAEGGSK